MVGPEIKREGPERRRQLQREDCRANHHLRPARQLPAMQCSEYRSADGEQRVDEESAVAGPRHADRVGKKEQRDGVGHIRSALPRLLRRQGNATCVFWNGRGGGDAAAALRAQGADRPTPAPSLFAAIRLANLDVQFFAVARHTHGPRVATYFAILDVTAAHVGFDVNLDLLAAIRARHKLRIIRLHSISLTGTSSAK